MDLQYFSRMSRINQVVSRVQLATSVWPTPPHTLTRSVHPVTSVQRAQSTISNISVPLGHSTMKQVFTSFHQSLTFKFTTFQSPPYAGQQNSTACRPCEPGFYCDNHGLSTPTGPCSPGWYCTLGSYLAQPTSPEGGMCVAGQLQPLYIHSDPIP